MSPAGGTRSGDVLSRTSAIQSAHHAPRPPNGPETVDRARCGTSRHRRAVGLGRGRQEPGRRGLGRARHRQDVADPRGDRAWLRGAGSRRSPGARPSTSRTCRSRSSARRSPGAWRVGPRAPGPRREQPRGAHARAAVPRPVRGRTARDDTRAPERHYVLRALHALLESLAAENAARARPRRPALGGPGVDRPRVPDRCTAGSCTRRCCCSRCGRARPKGGCATRCGRPSATGR